MRGRQPFTRRVPLPRLPHLASGQVMIIFAMAALVLVGFVALAVDTGFLMAEKRQTQSAADALPRRPEPCALGTSQSAGRSGRMRPVPNGLAGLRRLGLRRTALSADA